MSEAHGPDLLDSEDGEPPSCLCGFNGTPEDCEASRDYGDFEAWAKPQLPKFSGPARWVTAHYLLRNIWQKDPEVRKIFRDGRAEMAAGYRTYVEGW